MNGKLAKAHIQQVIDKIDEIDSGDIEPNSQRFYSSKWLRKFVAPAAIGISIGLCGCTDNVPVYGAPVEDADYDEVTDTDVQQDADARQDADVQNDADQRSDTDVTSDADEESDGNPDADRDSDTQTDASPDADEEPDGSGGPEVCNDSRDNDGDGLCDCFDSDCDDSADCIPSCPRYMAPLTEDNCSDCHDNDCDDKIDCDDEDCADDPVCSG